jgi:trk system potassium uptake protein TrkA
MLIKNKKSKVVIVGLNDISISLAEKLSSIYEVNIVYYNNSSNDEMWKELDVTTRKIHSNLSITLKEYNPDNIKAYLSLTSDGEFNMFSTWLANDYGFHNTFAMVRDSSYQKIKDNKSLNIFNPFQLIINIILTQIEETYWESIKGFLPSNLFLLKTKITKQNKYSKLINNNNMNPIAIQKGSSTIISFSVSNIEIGDYLYILCKKSFINNFKLYKKNFLKRRLMIFGGNKFGEEIALFFKNVFNPVIIIEPDHKKCEKLASRLNDPLIIQGEGVNLELLRSEGIKENSIYIASSNDDFHNILSTYGALKLGCQEGFTILNNKKNIGISTILNLNNVITVPQIISRYLSSIINLDLKNGVSLFNNNIFAFLIKVRPSMNIINNTIKQINHSNNITIGAIIRSNRIILPTKEEQIIKNDSLVIFSNYRIKNIDHLFK